MSSCLSVIGNMITNIFSVQMPYGVSYGVIIIGTATFPLLLAVIKKIF